MKHLSHIVLIFCLIFLSSCDGGDSSSDKELSTIVIKNMGSDTMVNLALGWAERYQQLNPQAQISVTGGGSGTGISALINGTIDIANASRSIKPEEIEEAQANGFTPEEFIVSGDAIAVIVNPANPVSKLTLQQISSIYKCEINNWREVGGEDRPIVRLSRESNSGTHVYFLEQVVRQGSKEDLSIFCPQTLLLPSSEGIIAEVRDNPNALGYDGLGYVTEEVKVISVARSVNKEYIYPSVETVNNGSYPIARDLFMYTRDEPTGALLNYINWIFSDEAQQIVKDQGFVPVEP